MSLRPAAQTFPSLPLVPLFGHRELTARLARRVASRDLPQSLLLHGTAGVGKQRIALWLAQSLLCSAGNAGSPCGSCRDCRYVLELVHPDLTWVFPRPRPKESDSEPEDIAEDLAEERGRRVAASGLCATPPGNEGIYISTVRFMVRQASRTPALAKRKVFVVGDADRMAQQEGAEAAANAFLKLLEEPPADTTIVMTTSALGALLPTIRSRVVALRVPRLDEASMRAFLDEPAAKAALEGVGLPSSVAERLRLAQGSPGRLLSSRIEESAIAKARRFLDAATSGNRADALKVAFSQGHAGARGAFSDALDALTLALHDRMRAKAVERDEAGARSASKAMDYVEEAKRRAEGNVSPQLITAQLMYDLARTLS